MRRLLAALALAAPLQAQPAKFNDAWRPAAAEFHRQMDDGFVGGSLWFVHNGQVLAREHHGFADLDTKRRIDENTIYHWASITKTFTAIAIMQLRDRGRLTLDDPILNYLPELRGVHNPYGPMQAITIRHLLTHSAGFRGGTWPWGGDKPWHPHEPATWEQLVAMVPYTEILFAPGSKYSYSNPGIIFLGRIIAQLSGDDYEVYVDKNILKPLGMYRAYYDVTPYHLLAYRSNNYTVKDGKLTANGLDFDTGITTSNGGLNAPIPDMVKYLSFLTGAGDTAVYNAVLKRSSLEEMWRPALAIQSAAAGDRTAWNAAWAAGIGLSYFIYDQPGVRIVGHTGSQKSFNTFIYFEPATRAAAILALNTTGDPKPSVGTMFTNMRGEIFNTMFPLFRAQNGVRSDRNH
jgi:CubicO group peptidase (beta-lactamase class C family)